MSTLCIQDKMEFFAKNGDCNRRKTRRGKKKYRCRFLPISTHCCDCTSRFEPVSQLCTKCNKGVAEPGEKQVNTQTRSGRKSKIYLRPVTTAGAPHNSNQFLIEDHLNCEQDFKLTELSCTKREKIDDMNLLHFEDSGYGSSVFYEPSDQCLSPSPQPLNWKTSPAFSDIDYKYVPVQNEDDMLMFLEKDFEQVYQHTREQELMTRNRVDLISDIEKLRTDVDNLRQIGLMQQHRRCDNSSVNVSLDLISLQKELDELKRENFQLTEENKKLKQAANAIPS